MEQHPVNLLTEIARRRPKIVFLDPPCTWYSQLLSLNWKHMPRHIREERLATSMVLFEFCLLIMRIQLLAGRAFVLEHTHAATSRKHPQVQDALRRFPGTAFADFDFCMFGMATKIKRVPMKKATRLMTHCMHIYRRFAGVRCDGSHNHAICLDSEGGRGGEAVQICAVLPAPLLRLPCRVLRGLLQEHALLNLGKDACRVI